MGTHTSILRWPWLALTLLGCGIEPVLETLPKSQFDVVVVATADTALSGVAAIADERGGGVFLDTDGKVHRLRATGVHAPLEAHPKNPFAPGAVTTLLPLGPASALAVTATGAFVVDQGWLIAPTWQSSVTPEGLHDAAIDRDGTVWLAHSDGLFLLQNGQLSELTVNGKRQSSVTALAVAPDEKGERALWFAREGKLFQAVTSDSGIAVRESGLSQNALGRGIVGLAGIGPSSTSAGELWVLTDRRLLTYSGLGWRQYELPATPRSIRAGGRFAWLELSDRLLRYDATRRFWSQANGLENVSALLSVDAAGTAWVQQGETVVNIAPSVGPRVGGLFESAQVFDGQLVVEALVPVDAPTDTVEWELDGTHTHSLDAGVGLVGAGATAGQRVFSLGGLEPNGLARPISLAALLDGWHTLSVRTTHEGESRTRALAFEFRGAANAAVSWSRDLSDLSHDRCGGCHAVDTEPELITYEQWKENASKIAAAVREGRMPAGSPLDPAGVSVVVRWVNGGTLP